MKNIFVIIGESGSGKTTLAKGITTANKNIELLVTTTTRPPRKQEKNNIDYNFLELDEFKSLITAKRFIEFTTFREWYYGLDKDVIFNCKSDNMLVVLSPIGLKNLITNLNKNEYKIIPIYLYADERIRLIRTLSRDVDVDEVIRRTYTDRADFHDMPSYVLKNNGYIIKNDSDLEKTMEQLMFCMDWNEVCNG